MNVTADMGALGPEVLIVGAGAVGLALGIELARGGRRVLIVEAGGPDPDVNFQTTNGGRSAGRTHNGLSEGRMKALGGTTRLWGGQLVPFGMRDFDGAAPDGTHYWPVRHAEIAPWIAAAFRFLGIGEEGSDPDAVWQRVTGLPSDMGPNLRLGMNIWLPQPDFTRLFAQDLAGLIGLTVLTDSVVERLLFEGEQGVVTGVETLDKDGKRHRHVAPAVVLANGTLEIAGLLLRTAATQPASGFSDNTNIGRGFIDHLHGTAGRVVLANHKRAADLFDNVYFERRKYGVKLRALDEFRAKTGISNCAAMVVAPSNVGTMVRDLATLARRLVKRPARGELAKSIGQAVTLSRIIVPLAFRYIVQRRSTSLLSQGAMLWVEAEQVPTPESYIMLEADQPPETAGLVLHWALDGREIDAIATFCAEVKTQFEQAGLGTVEIDPRITARDPAFLDTMHDSYHQMGGARMAEGPAEGVVDRDLKVFGTRNLYVLGAAAYPTGSFANPTLTAIAFAMRLAEHLTRAIPAVAA